MSSVISISNLDSKKIIITKLKLNKTTKKYSAAFLNIEGKQANLFAFETSYLSIDFPPNYYGEQNKDSIVPDEQRNYSIVFRPNGGSMEVSDQSERFMEFLDDLKNMAIDFGIDNSGTVLKKKFDKSQREIMVETSFTSPVKQKAKADGTLYPPNVTVKIPKRKESNFPDISLFKDHAGTIEQIDLNVFDSWDKFKEIAAKGIKCKAIIRPMLSFINKSMNFTLRLVQLKVFTVDKLTIPRSYAFSDVPMISHNPDESTEKDDVGISATEFGGETIIVESDEEVDVSDA
jgi:hypothetical protein